MKFGDKVRFKEQDKVHVDLRQKEFCLIGFDNSAFAIIEWHKRGQYNFEFYTGNVFETLVHAV